MVDYKSGASFVYDTTFADLLDMVKGKAYGVEAGIIKRAGNLTSTLSYTYSRSKQEYHIPEGLIWIPANADRSHNFNLTLKYHLKPRTSFGLNWVYQSGAPATVNEQETSYGEFFDTKNNIRYFDYRRLDLSIRHAIFKRRFTIFLDADVYNVYNRKNTYYFKKLYDWMEKRYYFKNISLFPVMPSLTITVKY
jgi:predicted porin